jgi:hypothetical protein
VRRLAHQLLPAPLHAGNCCCITWGLW